jgi:hypothetical protein
MISMIIGEIGNPGTLISDRESIGSIIRPIFLPQIKLFEFGDPGEGEILQSVLKSPPRFNLLYLEFYFS